ncbi:hypothetical protein L596_009773 [Steinernema carpocapsae]|uniref:Uncharacterized protein n=1 Tax=Steinernema carpocapsae TaxID=34508 RepID=A0A4U5PGB4_STECR|nr:hypothetical protein L596_009773 [Steinernema carpocapsae]
MRQPSPFFVFRTTAPLSVSLPHVFHRSLFRLPMVFRRLLNKALALSPLGIIRDVTIPMVSLGLDFLLLVLISPKWTKNMFSGLSSNDVMLLLFSLTVTLHGVVLASMFSDLLRRRILRWPIKLIGYNFVTIGVVIYGYYYNKGAFQNGLSMFIIRILLYVIYRLGRANFWIAQNWPYVDTSESESGKDPESVYKPLEPEEETRSVIMEEIE